MLDALFIFVSAALPKAGIQLGAVPLAASIVLLAIVIIRNPLAAVGSLRLFPGQTSMYFVLIAFGGVSTLLALGEGIDPYSLAERIIVLASPLALVAATRVDADKAAGIIAVALIITGAYAAVQFIAGITAVSVPGITFTFGQELTVKNNGYDTASDSALKMPSTYQAGNTYGLFAVLGLFLMASWSPAARSGMRIRKLGLVGGILGILFCGSRSIVLPAIVVCGWLILVRIRKLPKRPQLLVVAGLLVTLPAALSFLFAGTVDVFEAFWQRNVVSTVSDPTATGRTDQWDHLARYVGSLNGADLVQFLLLGDSYSWEYPGEGLPIFLATFGIPSTVAFFGGLLVVIRSCWVAGSDKVVAFGLAAVFAAFLVDSTFFRQPSISNFYIVAGVSMALGAKGLRRAVGGAGMGSRDEHVARVDETGSGLRGEGLDPAVRTTGLR